MIGIEYISPFKRFAYKNTYIYNLIAYFSRHMYLYPTASTSINNIIFLFYHYSQANFKLYAVYMDAGLHFISQNLCTYFQKIDIVVIFALTTSHESVGLIATLNDIFQQKFQKIQESRKKGEDAVF